MNESLVEKHGKPYNKHIAIFGPTASGKSALALQYAEKYNGVIVNFDSQQIYKEIPIITAQPDKNDLNLCDHRLYGHVEYSVQYNFNLWLRDFYEVANKIISANKTIIAVGGTGLYLNALLNGAIPMPNLDRDHIERLRVEYLSYSSQDLHAKLKELDPEYADALNLKDRARIFRALSFCEITGDKYSKFRARENTKNPAVQSLDFYKIYIRPPRDELYKSINNRFEDMIKHGAIDEVKALYEGNPQQDFTKATGVKEIVAYLNDEMSYQDMIDKSQQLTRNYAKRQFTWFNNQVKADKIIDMRC